MTALVTVAAAPTYVRAARLRRIVRQLSQHRLAIAAIVFLVILAAIAIFAPTLAPFDPRRQDYNAINRGLGSKHWLGTDALGRDILSRLMFGARVSLMSSVFAIGCSLIVAVPVGVLSGYLGGAVDTVVMRVVDGLQCIPPLILALALLGLLGPSLRNIVIALGIIFVPGFVRLTRGQVLAVKEENYIEASRSIGSSAVYIMRKRVLHNIASPLIVQASVAVGFGLLAEAGLSFLGLGIQPPDASWGSMLNDAYSSIYVAPGQIFVPGCAIALTIFAFNVVGDGLRDVLGVDAAVIRKQPQ
jgi:peptide/nickel transport system permease protein